MLMMSNRNVSGTGLGDFVSSMKYYEYTGSAIDSLESWTKLSKSDFVKRLQGIAASFPLLPESQNANQKHVSVFVHGYNNGWIAAAQRYAQIKRNLFDQSDLGCLILYSWPSAGSVAGYLPDREEARASAGAFAAELVDLHAQILRQQSVAARTQDPAHMCRAKISIIAHSMGNYVTQTALAVAAKQLNSPQLVTLVTQLAMVAADVDNDIFQKDKPLDSDGSLMANLCYRIGALYTGLDQVLGASAGLKHFGVRRLGRSGLADAVNVWDNVFDKDVSAYLDLSKEIHSAVFDSPKALALLEQILRGVDRSHLPDS
jgi:esterase/lipase superfamily enzyme